MKKLISALKNNKGATAIEYGLIISLIGATIALSLSDLSTAITDVFDTVRADL